MSTAFLQPSNRQPAARSPVQRPMRNRDNISELEESSLSNTNTSTTTCISSTITCTMTANANANDSAINSTMATRNEIQEGHDCSNENLILTKGFDNLEKKQQQGAPPAATPNDQLHHTANNDMDMDAKDNAMNDAAIAKVIDAVQDKNDTTCTRTLNEDRQDCNRSGHASEECNSNGNMLDSGTCSVVNGSQIDGTQTAILSSASARSSSSCAIIPYTYTNQTSFAYSTITSSSIDADTNTNANTISNENDHQTQFDNNQNSNSNTNIPHKGIVNLGNTCYLNSGLQMLMSIDGFVEELIALYQHDVDVREREIIVAPADADADDCESTPAPPEDSDALAQAVANDATFEFVQEDKELGDKVPKESKKYPLRDALAQFFLSVKNHHQGPGNDHDHGKNTNTIVKNDTCNDDCNTDTDPGQKAVAPTDLETQTDSPSTTAASPLSPSVTTWNHQSQAANPMNLKKQIDEMTPQFVGFWQQDSHEFLSTLLDLLHDEIVANECASSAVTCSGSNDSIACSANIEPESAMIMVENDNCDYEDARASTCMGNENGSSSCVSGGNELEVATETENVPMDMDLSMKDSTLSEWSSLSASASSPSPSINNPLEEELDSDFVVVEKEDFNDCHTPISGYEYGASSKKKARVAASPNSLTKTSSFSELNMEEIRSLLHGRRDAVCKDEVSAPFSTVSNMSCKLIGGRIASIAPPAIKILEREEEDEPITGSSTESMNGTDDEQDDDGQNRKNDDATGPSNVLNNNDNVEESSAPSKPLWTDNVVDHWFTMAVRTHLRCDSCNYTRSHEEVYRYLSIEVGPAPDCSSVDSVAASHERSIQESIRKFFKPENRELKCEKCFCENATQSTEIIKLPKALIVHLKRFIVDVSNDYSSITYRKNQAAFEFGHDLSLNENDHDGVLGDFLSADVSFPGRHRGAIPSDEVEELDCEDSTCASDFDFDVKSISGESFMDVAHFNPSAQQKYKIRSVVNHIGDSANCGHYTADAYKSYSNKDTEEEISPSSGVPLESSQGFRKRRKWTRFNDSFVSQVEEVDAMGEKAQQTAYMITYELKIAKSE